VQVVSEDILARYANVTVRAGLNLQPHQRLLIAGPPLVGGISFESAPLIRAITSSAYAVGARLVEVLWGDDAILRARFAHAPRDSFGEFSPWLADVACRHAEAGHAVLNVRSMTPGLLNHADPALIGQLSQAMWRQVGRFNDLIMRNPTNWCVIAAPNAAWAARVFPDDVDPVGQLWEVLVRVCRLDGPIRSRVGART